MGARIRNLKVYVPARDFEESKRFYKALGFGMTPAWDRAVDVELDGSQFRLQDYYVKEWADNCMILMDVDNVEQWHQRAKEALEGGSFRHARLTAPEDVDGSRVLHVWDPPGVLLVFVE